MVKHPVSVGVGRRALMARIKRVLVRRQQRLKMHRRAGGRVLMVIDDRRGAVVELDVDLADLGRRLGVLAPYEHLADD
jgi:hypothetical protein